MASKQSAQKTERTGAARFVGGVLDGERKRFVWPFPPTFEVPGDAPKTWHRYSLKTSDRKRAVYELSAVRP